MTPTPFHAFLLAHAGTLWLALAAALVLAIVACMLVLLKRAKSAHKLVAKHEATNASLRQFIDGLLAGQKRQRSDTEHEMKIAGHVAKLLGAEPAPAGPTAAVLVFIEAIKTATEAFERTYSGAVQPVPEPVETPLPPASPPAEVPAPEHVPAAADPIPTPEGQS